MKKILHFLLCLLVVILAGGCDVKASGEVAPPIKNSALAIIDALTNKAVPDPADKLAQNAVFKLTMLDVGQGLSVLVESGGRFMVYDGGNRERSSYVVSYLKKHKISNIDYLIASHYDEDHIAGLVGILKTASVRTAIIPPYENSTKIYDSFMEALQSASSVLYAKTGNSYKLGNATIDILYACNGTEETDNNRSTVIKVSCGRFSCLLTGDAEYETEDLLVRDGADLDCVLYIVGHHGSRYSSSQSFVKAMRPKMAFISVGGDNPYGHPAEETLATLNAGGVAVYRTDLQGVISLFYDGSDYHVVTEKDLTQRMEATDEPRVTSKENARYVLNVSSMKFHLPECDSVYKMSFYNRKYSLKSREDLIKDGYSPCGACNP